MKGEYKGTKVAIKKIFFNNISFKKPEELIKDFQEEAITMRNLPSHPNVVSILIIK